MPGENTLADSKMSSLLEKLDRYHERHGVLKLKPKNEAEKYLNLSHNEIRLLTAEECNEAGVILSQYAMFIQGMYNREISKVHWVDTEIEKTVMPKLAQYTRSYQSYEERRLLAINDNEYTKNLMELRMYAQNAANDLSFIANRVDNIARAYMNLAQTKRVKRYE